MMELIQDNNIWQWKGLISALSGRKKSLFTLFKKLKVKITFKGVDS